MKDNFGLRLRFYRNKLNLTQHELADKAGVSRKQISDFEMGIQKNPRLSTLQKLADALNISVEKLSDESFEFLDNGIRIELPTEIYHQLTQLADAKGQSIEETSSAFLENALSNLSIKPNQNVAQEDDYKDKRIAELEKQLEYSMKMLEVTTGMFEAMLNGNSDEYMENIFKRYPNVKRFFRENTKYPFSEKDQDN